MEAQPGRTRVSTGHRGRNSPQAFRRLELLPSSRLRVTPLSKCTPLRRCQLSVPSLGNVPRPGPHSGVLLRESLPKARVSADSLQTHGQVQLMQALDSVSSHIPLQCQQRDIGAVPRGCLNGMVKRGRGSNPPLLLSELTSCHLLAQKSTVSPPGMLPAVTTPGADRTQTQREWI